MITGTTRVAGLIGYPARYSLSPILHAAAYESLGIDATYVVFPVKSDAVEAAVSAVRALDLMGLSVTLPHKESVIPFMDELSPQARLLNAVNTIVPTEGGLMGHNTDGAGFLNTLLQDESFDPAHKRCVVIGAGGAAKAVVAELARADVADLAVVNRSEWNAQEAAALAGPKGRVGSDADYESADLIVNATPVGMEASPGVPMDVALIPASALVMDLIYKPEQTELLRSAQDRGCRTANGLGMLVHQAAEQVLLWSGQRPSTNIMRSALDHH